MRLQLEMLGKQLDAIEESELAYTAGFIVPLAKLRKEAPQFVKQDRVDTFEEVDGEEEDHANKLAASKRPFLHKVMADAIKTARRRALNSSAAAAEVTPSILLPCGCCSGCFPVAVAVATHG